MSSSRLVRGAKTRMFAFMCLISVLGALVYVFHGTQARLADVQKIANDCSQQQESLSAQLQVIFEYKLRLEKSLKKEKEDHNLTKDTCKAREKEEREAREKEKIEAANKYEALVQQSKLEKSQVEDEKEALLKEMESLRESKKELQALLGTAKEETLQLKLTNDNLKKEVGRLKDQDEERNRRPGGGGGGGGGELGAGGEKCKEELDKTNALLKECREEKRNDAKMPPPVMAAPLLAAQSPALPLEPPKWSPLKGNSSTTPGINPDALYSPDPSPGGGDQRPEQQIKPDNQVIIPQVAVPPKKSTPEGVNNGGGQGGLGMMNGLVGQIPGPPEPPQPAAVPVERPQQQRMLGPLNPMIEEKRVDAAVEEEDIRQREIPRGRGENHYHGGDYDKEQPEEEEDEEGEQLDYVQANDQMRKEMHNNGPGVMLNPK